MLIHNPAIALHPPDVGKALLKKTTTSKQPSSTRNSMRHVTQTARCQIVPANIIVRPGEACARCVMMQSAESLLVAQADADLYISLCEEGNLSLSTLCAPHHILPCARVVHVTGTEFGSVSSSIASINAPFPVHFNAVVCLQQHQNAFHILQAHECVHNT